MILVHTIFSTRTDRGGTSRSVPALCDAVAQLCRQVHLVAARTGDDADYCWPGNLVRVHKVLGGASGGSLLDARRFRRAVEAIVGESRESLIHDHGVWLPANHASASAARRTRAPRVVSPRGMLSPWALRRRRWKKNLAWVAYQGRDLHDAAAFHVTSPLEEDEVRRLGFTQPVIVIPNGVGLPVVDCEAPRPGGRRMLFLSRIHPKKGLVNLLRAWHGVRPGREWRLVIAGPDEGGHLSEIRRLSGELGLLDQVDFPGEIADADKWTLYAHSDVFVLPSFSENFGNAVAEALIAGVPAITTTGTPWATLPELNIGWQCEPTVAGLEAAVRAATSSPPESLHEMGRRGAEWAKSQFSWQDVGRRMIAAYQWLLGGGPRPEFVHVS